MRIGIECGGTFTDIVAVDGDGSIIATNKVFSTPHDPALAVLEGLDSLPDRSPGSAELLHGSTVATNALLERKGGPIALVTTEGFRDLVFLQRQDRARMYELDYRKPIPLVERSMIFEVEERVSAAGNVLIPLSDSVDAVVRRVVESGAQAVAISLLHAYVNPVHELDLERRLRAAGLTVPISLSHQVAREFREYERTTTTLVDAFIRPRVSAYLGHLASAAASKGVRSIGIMQSNGGLVPPEVAISRPVTMLLSGPAAGVSGAVRVGREAGIDSIVTMDMGGTSTDVAFIQGGSAGVVADTVVDGLPLRVPLVDINTVGAGGGSIVAIDGGGLLTVGPRSAGADPGPACYGRGGLEPTVTDANLIVGIMPSDTKLAGRFSLNASAARNAFEPLAKCLGASVEEVAAQAIRLANIAMAGTIREVSLERGHELDEAVLIAYGGAGALHAASVAEELGVSRVIVPPNSGLTSAVGLLTSAFTRDHATTWFQQDLAVTPAQALNDQRKAMLEEIREELRTQGIDPEPLTATWTAEARYRGQGFELPVPISETDDPAAVIEAFHGAHARQFGHASRDRAVQLVTLRVRLTGAEPPMPRAILDPVTTVRPATRLWVDGEHLDAPVLERSDLSGFVPGPAVIADRSATTLVPVGWAASLDEHSNLVLERSAS